MSSTRSPSCCLCGTPWELWLSGVATGTQSNIARVIDSVALGYRRTDFRKRKDLWYMAN